VTAVGELQGGVGWQPRTAGAAARINGGEAGLEGSADDIVVTTMDVLDGRSPGLLQLGTVGVIHALILCYCFGAMTRVARRGGSQVCHMAICDLPERHKAPAVSVASRVRKSGIGSAAVWNQGARTGVERAGDSTRLVYKTRLCFGTSCSRAGP
jgi:hypothetical protein